MTTPNTLSAAHQAELRQASAIDLKFINQRGYRTIDDIDDLPNEFLRLQMKPGLLIPIHTVRGKVESWQLKPTNPRIGKNGKPIKYETASKAPQVIDVPPASFQYLQDISMPMVITEGAKKVDSALSSGMLCVIGLNGVYGWRGTNPDGGKTALADWESIALNNREVLLAFDSDVMTKPGPRDAVQRLYRFLTAKGALVSYLVMPDLPDGSKCGLDDWFAAGNEMMALQQYIRANLPSLEEPIAADQPPVLLEMTDIEAKPIDWLWNGWIPKGMITLLGGYAGDGKSTLTMSLAATLSTGGTLPDGTGSVKTNTLLLVAEDDLAHVVKPRLDVHKADHTRITVLQGVKGKDGAMQTINLKRDLNALRAAIVSKNIGLVIMDPVSSFFANSDRNNEGEVRDILGPLIQTLEATGCALLGIMHIGKGDGQAKAMQKLMGSTAFTALARSVMMVSDLPQEFQVEGEPVRKMLGVAKSNYAVKPPALTFARPLDGAVQYLGASPVTIEDVFTWKSAVEKPDRETETSRAEEWLLTFMDGKPVPASAVEAAAKDEGFTLSVVQRAKKRLGLSSQKTGDGWQWLPPVSDQAA